MSSKKKNIKEKHKEKIQHYLLLFFHLFIGIYI